MRIKINKTGLNFGTDLEYVSTYISKEKKVKELITIEYLSKELIMRKEKNKVPIILVGKFWKSIIDSVSLLVSEKELSLLTIVDSYLEIKKYL